METKKPTKPSSKTRPGLCSCGVGVRANYALLSGRKAVNGGKGAGRTGAGFPLHQPKASRPRAPWTPPHQGRMRSQKVARRAPPDHASDRTPRAKSAPVPKDPAKVINCGRTNGSFAHSDKTTTEGAVHLGVGASRAPPPRGTLSLDESPVPLRLRGRLTPPLVIRSSNNAGVAGCWPHRSGSIRKAVAARV